MRIFGGDRIQGLMKTLKIPEDQPIKSGLISGSIESAQGKIEGYHFDARKHVLDYDEVLNKQRQIIYGKRKEILSDPVPVVDMIDDELLKMVEFHTEASHPADWNIEEIFENMKGILTVDDGLHNKLSAIRKKSADPEVLRKEIEGLVLGVAQIAYKEREEKVGKEKMRELEKFIMLRTLDMLWMDHLETTESLRDSVKLRAYGQKDPLVEYKREGREMFNRLLDTFQTQVVHTIFKVELKEAPEAKKVEGVENRGGGESRNANEGARKSQKTVGRNAPCHCGSGKKYKKCCARLKL